MFASVCTVRLKILANQRGTEWWWNITVGLVVFLWILRDVSWHAISHLGCLFTAVHVLIFYSLFFLLVGCSYLCMPLLGCSYPWYCSYFICVYRNIPGVSSIYIFYLCIFVYCSFLLGGGRKILRIYTFIHRACENHSCYVLCNNIHFTGQIDDQVSQRML